MRPKASPALHGARGMFPPLPPRRPAAPHRRAFSLSVCLAAVLLAILCSSPPDNAALIRPEPARSLFAVPRQTDSGPAVLASLRSFAMRAVSLRTAQAASGDAASSAPAGRQSAGGNERILLYDVTAVFDTTGDMHVREEITVLARGRAIRRGIIRDLPTRWERADNKIFAVEYDVLGVTRDGKPEPYTLSQGSKQISLRIGNPNAPLTPGEHTYAITYTVRNHFSRFSGWDELYWNVTGNDWTFPIDKVRFRLRLPAQGGKRAAAGTDENAFGFRSVDIYTGKYGGKERTQSRRLPDDSVETTAPLAAGEGLTVVYTWPRSILKNAPDPVNTWDMRYMLLPTKRTIGLWTVPLALAAFFAARLWRTRPRVPRPAVIPRFEPPQGMSPGFARHVITKGYSADSFAADLLNLVAKGAASLEHRGGGTGNIVLRKQPQDAARSSRNTLNDAEQKLLDEVFSGGRTSVHVSHRYQPNMIAAREAAHTTCLRRGKGLFYSVWGYGFAVSLLVYLLPLLSYLFLKAEKAAGATLLVYFVTYCLVGFMSLIVGLVLQRRPNSDILKKNLGWLPVLAVVVLPVLALWFLFDYYTFVAMPAGYMGALALATLTSLLFFAAASSRTDIGNAKLAEAKGLRLYLATAEESRYEALYPPEEMLRHFERLLPYALALGVGKTFAATFAAWCAKTGMAAEQFHNFQYSDFTEFRSHSSEASQTRPSESSGSSGGDSSSSGSGSSGGGFSGGGSGGGGGSGW